MKLKDGIIELGASAPFGFTSDLFEGYLWKVGKAIYISLIISKQPRQGNLRRLLDTILKAGYTIKIPTPLGRMEYIVRQHGYVKTNEFFKILDEPCDVWVKKPES